MRYAEATIIRDGPAAGAFSLDGVAPGRYRLVALPDAPQAQTGAESSVFLSAEGRARLRRETEKLDGRDITLAPCQHLDNVRILFAPAGKSGAGEQRER